MTLSDSDRAAVWADWMRAGYGTVAVTKPQLRAAVNAADDWVESAIAGLTAALPESLRAGAAPTVLLANTAAIGRGAGPDDVSAGIVTDRSNPGPLLAGYQTANTWLTANITAYLTAVALAGAGALTTAQSLAVLESVCRRRAA